MSGAGLLERGAGLCVIDDADTVIWRGRTASTGEAIGAALKAAHAPNAARIGLESGQLAVWLFHAGMVASGKLAGCDKIGVRVGKVIGKYLRSSSAPCGSAPLKFGKHFDLDIKDAALSFGKLRTGASPMGRPP